MRGRPIVLATLLIAGICLIAVGWRFTARSAYETAEYTVSWSEGEFEIRDYPELVLVSTSSDRKMDGNDGSFMRLFRYISGDNEQQQKVAMTTPVFMNEDGGGNAMGFVIPKEVAEQGAPEPASNLVELRTRQAGRYAVIRFAGRLNQETAKDAESRLRVFLQARNLIGIGDVEFAGYDPPWTPGPLRRNEALIRLSD